MRGGQMGDTLAQYCLGYFYNKGQGVAKDEAEAVKCYRNGPFLNSGSWRFERMSMEQCGNGLLES
jgi:hypothetical protein